MSATALSPAAPSWTFNGVVRFTRVGTAFLIFTIVVGFAALNTGNNALYIGLSFMLGCLLLSGVASQGGLRQLEVEVVSVDEAWAGKPVHCVLRVRNRSWIWNVRDVVIISAELAQSVLVPLCPKRGTAEVNAAFLFPKRGLVRLHRIDLYTRYPFGFFLKKRRAPLSGEMVVYPRLLPEEMMRTRFRPVIGEQTNANRPGPGSEIHSFRDYARGDSLRHVYWKKSASLGRWITKQTELEAAHVIHAVVDPFKPRSATDEDFEMMVSAAATFLHHAIRRGMVVMLSLPRVTLHAGESGAASAMFRALALLEPTYEPVEPMAGTAIVLFSLRSSDDAESA